MTTTDRTTAELADTVKRIWRHSFQAELDSALEQRLRAQALVGVKAIVAQFVKTADLAGIRASHSFRYCKTLDTW